MDFINSNYKKLIICLFILTVFTSILDLGNTPYGIHVDEAGMAYDAICLVNHGVDRYLNPFPVYLINYGGGQSAMYAYLSAFLIKIFGYSLAIVRLPSVLFRILIFISILFIMKNENNKFKTLIFLFLFSICPYFIMQSRWGLDCNLLVGFLTVSVCLLIRAVENNSNKLFIASGILFGLTLYTYALSYFIIPVFLFFTCIYLLCLRKISFPQLIIFGIPIFLLAIPLMLMLLVNNGIIQEIKGFITIPLLGFYRGSEFSLSNIFDNLYIIGTIFSFDNQNIFGEQLLYNALPQFGTVYYISIPFFIIGIATAIKKAHFSLKNKEFDINIIFIIWFFCVLVCQLLISNPNINKANAIFVPILYFITIGILFICNNFKKLILPIFALFIINFSLFIFYYFYQYNYDSQNLYWFATNYVDAISYSKTLKKEHVYVANGLTAESYIYVLLDNKVSPYDFSKDNIKTVYEDTEITYTFNDWDISNINENSVYIVENNDYWLSLFNYFNFDSIIFGNVAIFYNN